MLIQCGSISSSMICMDRCISWILKQWVQGCPYLIVTRPYQQIPFQYSLHVKEADQIKHFEFLAETDGTDPRISFIKQLILDCGSEGDILVYNISFEQSKIEELIQAFPGYQIPLEGIIKKTQRSYDSLSKRMVLYS